MPQQIDPTTMRTAHLLLRWERLCAAIVSKVSDPSLTGVITDAWQDLASSPCGEHSVEELVELAKHAEAEELAALTTRPEIEITHAIEPHVGRRGDSAST